MGKSFHVSVMGFDYRVKQAEQAIEDGGDELYGQIDFDNRTIYISPDCPPPMLLEVFGHEIAEAFIHHAPRFEDKEELCDQWGQLLATTIRSVEKYGGSTRLLLLSQPTQVLNPRVQLDDLNQESEVVERTNEYCDECGQTIGVGAVKPLQKAKPLVEHHESGVVVMPLGFICGFCEHGFTWTEHPTETKQPSGRVYDPRRRMTNDEMRTFCSQWAKESGIVYLD